ncbi:hypothetical protein [Rothia aeria]|uniref:VG15 protein n=1 Tax=Rothia aeria TaxID=172042 RepID=UPI003C7A276C
MDRTDAVQRSLAEAEVLRLTRSARLEAAKVGDQMLKDAARGLSVEPFIPEPEPYRAGSVIQAFRESTGKSDKYLAGILARHVRMAARRQVMRAVPEPVIPNFMPPEKMFPDGVRPVALEPHQSAEAFNRTVGEDGKARVYPIGWARVLTGRYSCGFCVMLASRGPVYTSAHHAGQSKPGGRDKFHNNCDCLVVPVFKSTDWAGRREYEQLREFYRATIDDVKAHPDKYQGKNAQAWLEQALKERGAPVGVPL